MEDRIIEIIESVSGFENLRENLEIDLLENEILDSLAFIELITTLDDEFEIEPDTWRSVEGIVELVEKYMALLGK